MISRRRQLRYNSAGIEDIYIKSNFAKLFPDGTLGIQLLIIKNLDGSIDTIDINYEDDVELIVKNIISSRITFKRKEKLIKINGSK